MAPGGGIPLGIYAVVCVYAFTIGVLLLVV